MEHSNRWILAVETGLVMFVCAAGLSSIQIFRGGLVSQAYEAVFGVPASAAAIFIWICTLSDGLLNVSRIRFPHNFTLPVTFCGLLPVCSLVIATPERGLLAPNGALAYTRLWQQPLELAVILFMEIVAISIYAYIPRVSRKA